MSRKREPEAVIGCEDYRIVRFTHDVELAEKLMREELSRDLGEPYTGSVGSPYKAYVRIAPALPNTYAHDQGWKFQYVEGRPGRGAFKAVIFT